MVGLFVTALVGLYTIADLWTKLGDKSISWRKYIFGHWAARIFGLIVIPMSVFMLSFKIHFDLLYKSGTGDANMSPLFQANLVGSSVGGGPREVSIVHSSVTIKNQGLSGGLLHSHVQTFPSGSKQQQVTTYGHKDSNNNWVFQRARGVPHYDTANNNTDIEYIIDGMTIRLMHKNTGRNLHSHEVDAPVSKAQWEVAAYGNLTLGDVKDNWVVEIMEQNSNEDKMRIHPLTTSFRLRHAYLGCYLATSGSNLPQWGFRQGEVVCHKDPFKKDKRTWWIIEDNENPILPPPSEDFKLPKTKFIKDFIQLNLAMMATNNALVPDEEKQDDLASDFWQWPSLNVGIRMCGWGSKNPKYFMIGSPATTWTSTVGVFAFALLVIYYLVRWQRQIIDFPSTNPDKLKRFLMGGIYPMFGWGLHYVPFVIMGRVKYVHHYMPALYFAMLVFCYEVDSFSRRLNDRNASVASKLSYAALYLGLYALVGGTFYYFRYFSFGMEGPKEDWKHLQLLRSWRVADDNYR
ncbi:uncharacterized protein SPAPADRAFT_62391 [Spathaspora passalidarum NRRL Y-27907]|uniref:Dolichyl-phosphate-mannose--protein mannosyltransferase n=1 Tax=Spathaspora passalidarum (strain NRRL Y-27907 / 11-Y1) TaxID=619300 RepID=G3ARP6_SPAPN|nr:uncharacterized protein SPAPADRAFT_62391 [Spathaspora passalidarum NRRL Y-27907]EGW31799.1 hypothetical protein SPAPADRAFT_62391 [Spathaspora passalidarum NRRL Y-27907]